MKLAVQHADGILCFLCREWKYDYGIEMNDNKIDKDKAVKLGEEELVDHLHLFHRRLPALICKNKTKWGYEYTGPFQIDGEELKQSLRKGWSKL